MSRIVPTGLLSTLDPTLIKPGAVAASANAIFEHGLIEARAGIAQLYKHTNVNSGSAFSSTDVFKGWGLGKYDDFDVLAAVIQPSGAGDAFLYVYNITSGTEYHFNDSRWTGLAATDWRFAQYGPYLYAVNSTDTEKGRFWRLKISGTASNGVITVTDWDRVPIIFQDLEVASLATALIRPTPEGYPTLDTWGSGEFAGTVVTPVPYTQGYALVGDTVALDATDGHINLTVTTSGPRLRNSIPHISFSPTTLINFEKRRYFVCELAISPYTGGATPDTSTNTSFVASLQPTVYVGITGGVTVNAANLADTTKFRTCRSYISIYSDTLAYLWVDIDEVAYGSLNNNFVNAVKQIVFAIPLRTQQRFEMSIAPMVQGGAPMGKYAYWQFATEDTYVPNSHTFDPATYFKSVTKDLEYAIISHRAGPPYAETTATFSRIPASATWGFGSVPSLPPLGSRVRVTVPAPTGGYTHVSVFRRRHGDSDKWYCIYTGTGGVTFDDARVDATTDLTAWDGSGWLDSAAAAICPTSNYPPDASAIRTSDYNWGTQPAAFIGQCLTSWKGHLVIGSGAEVYFSYQGDATKYLKPERTLSGNGFLIDTEDPTIGRTMYMDNTISDKVLSLVAQDALYAVGYKGIYALIGDSASTATPFRKLPGAYGAISAEAVAGYQDGVIVGNATGLYYVRLSRLGQSVEQTTAIVEELTKDNRPFWELLIAKGTPNPLVVSVLDDVITACRGRFCMRRNKSGQWEYHEYSSTALTSGSTSPSNVWGTPITMGSLPTQGLAVTRGATKSTYTGFDFTIPTLSGSYLPGWSGMIFDSSIGSLGISRSGIVFRLEKATTNIKYKTDAGYAIPWAVAFGDFGGEARFRGTGVQLVIENQDSGNAAGAVRYLVEEFDGVSGSRVFGFDRAQTDTYLNKPAFGTRGATYATSILCSGNAAQKVIHFSLEGTDAGKGKGN